MDIAEAGNSLHQVEQPVSIGLGFPVYENNDIEPLGMADRFHNWLVGTACSAL